MLEKVENAQAGDVMAFGELVRMFQDAVYGVAYAMIGNFEDAQDIAQEVFIQAWRDLGSLREPARFPNWLYRIARNRCMDFLRRTKLDTVGLAEASAVYNPSPNPLEQAERKELEQSVLAAVMALSEKLRLTTTLFYINGYAVSEIAEFLSVSPNTVKWRLHDARERLKENIMKDKKMIDIMVDGALKSFPLPGDFADVVVRMVTSDGDLQKCIELMGGYAKSIADAQRMGMFVVEEEGEVESAGQLEVGQWGIGSTIVKRAYSGAGVARESDGVPDPLFVKGYQGHFKLAKENGCRLVIVHGSQYDHGFCGFVPCFYHAYATGMLQEKVKSIPTRATVREVRDEREREEGWDAFMRDPYSVKMGGESPGPVGYVVEQDGEPVGYLSTDGTSLTYKTREAVLAAMKWGKAEYAWSMSSHMSMHTQTILSLGGKYVLRPSCDVVGLDNEMVAIIDLIGLTQDLQGEFQSRLMASPAHNIDADFSIEMGGETVGFIVNSGRAEIIAQKQKIHRILPRWVVTRLYMGYYSGEDILNMGPIPYDRSDGKTPDDPNLDMKELHLPESEAELFKALFPKLWPCSCPDDDVWKWVMEEEGPKYQHEDLKTPEMKAQIDALRFPWIGY
jgi:RNA polymerase sigma factor (sigma-70 family)